MVSSRQSSGKVASNIMFEYGKLQSYGKVV
jgi:hypothetical protein